MSGWERPVWAPIGGHDGRRILHDHLAEAIDAICWQARLVQLARALEPAGEREGTWEAARERTTVT